MSDQAVAKLLRSPEPLVIIEAAAGCGKTYQGAAYAQEVVGALGDGRLLILTHFEPSGFGQCRSGKGIRVMR